MWIVDTQIADYTDDKVILSTHILLAYFTFNNK